jgi:glycerol-3-phosphate acyltransferase PlsY
MEQLWIYTLAGGYLLGSIPWAYIIGRFNGIDIRMHGSGNVGATNVLRVLGKGWGYTCFLLDFLKGAGPVLAVTLLAPNPDAAGCRECCPLNAYAPIMAVFATVAGHVWPVWLKFKGGKGVATAAGTLVPLAPLPAVAALLVWVVAFKISRYVSLASIIAAAALPLAAFGMRFSGVKALNPFPLVHNESLCSALLWVCVVLAVLVIAKHHGNIRRLLNGTENRFAKK